MEKKRNMVGVEINTSSRELSFATIVSSVLAILGSFNPETVSLEKAKYENVVRATGTAFFKDNQHTASVSFQIVRNTDTYTYMTVDLYEDHKFVKSVCLGSGTITRQDLNQFRKLIVYVVI